MGDKSVTIAFCVPSEKGSVFFFVFFFCLFVCCCFFFFYYCFSFSQNGRNILTYNYLTRIWLKVHLISNIYECTVNVLEFRTLKCLTKWHMQTDQTAPDPGLKVFAIPLGILGNKCIKSKMWSRMLWNKLFEIVGHLPYSYLKSSIEDVQEEPQW